jgi:imidazole glycerol-phosphate synthase subunit HisH
MKRVVVVDSGTGNLRSVEKALAHAGAEVTVTADADLIARADRVVVPGQGAFADCMAGLSRGGVAEALRAAVARGTPYLGMCLGLQVLFETSEEHGPVAGLGLLRGKVVRFPVDAHDGAGARVKVPHMGWNQVAAARADAVAGGAGAWFYFVHSYYAVPAEPVTVLTTSYAGVEVCAAVRKDNLFATQFHPEKSQAAGLALLGRFLAA